ncbi:MAG: deoxyhypusine synthase family protein [Deltaproteobacteria bacterium]|nr:deoxyhypusine synthase family protein [Deltaproteobacteria bacterium]
MASTSFGGRQLGEAADVLYRMAVDPQCFVVGTFSGAMTVAKQGLLLCDMIDRGILNAVVSTGALMAHGLVEAFGMTHFKYDGSVPDDVLYEQGYDRVYDTLELEKNLDDSEVVIREALLGLDPTQTLSSHLILRAIGKYLAEKFPDHRSILKSAYLAGVPVYVPAFTDSELGLDIALMSRRRILAGEKRLAFDPYLDLEDYTARVCEQDKLGIFTIGGGVPRNWAQQVGPYLDIIQKRIGLRVGKLQRFRYAVRICPEPVHWGGLSGCTYSEGVSWGKFLPRSEGGAWAEVPADATIAWPLVLAAVLERLKKEGRTAQFTGPKPRV